MNYRHASPTEVAFNLSELIDALHARGSLVILVRRWGDAAVPSFAGTINKADLFVAWWTGLSAGPAVVRPEYPKRRG